MGGQGLDSDYTDLLPLCSKSHSTSYRIENPYILQYTFKDAFNKMTLIDSERANPTVISLFFFCFSILVFFVYSYNTAPNNTELMTIVRINYIRFIPKSWCFFDYSYFEGSSKSPSLYCKKLKQDKMYP